MGTGCNIPPASAARDLRCIRSCPLSSTRNWFRLPLMYRPRAERRESSSLIALHWDGPSPRHSPIANLSNSGAYVLTSEKWNPGEIVSLTLQRKGEVEESSRLRFTVQVKAIRRDEDGVGVSFLLPRGTDLRLWESNIKPHVPQTEPEDVVREFRTAAAIAHIPRSNRTRNVASSPGPQQPSGRRRCRSRASRRRTPRSLSQLKRAKSTS